LVSARQRSAPGFSFCFLWVAVNKIDQDTLEGYQGDIALNHWRFNARLLELWLHPERDSKFTSGRQWFYAKPAGTPPPGTFDVHVLARPQPVLTLFWRQISVIPRMWSFLLRVSGNRKPVSVACAAGWRADV